MDMTECECDMTQILQNADFTVLQNLRLTCYKFRTVVASKLKDAAACATECSKKNSINNEKVFSQQKEIEAVKPVIDSMKLQQKIVDKKIVNALKKEDVLKKEIEDAKTRRDYLSLELVDLQQVADERKKEKKQKWEAFKRACHVYKENLDIDIQPGDFSDNNSYENIKILFFLKNGAYENEFYVNLLYSHDVWKVEKIQPILQEKHIKDLKNLVQYSDNRIISDITAFLCELRHLFLEYYMKSR